MTYQRQLVSVWILPGVTYNVAMAVVWGNKTRYVRYVKVEGDPKEWCDVRVIHGGGSLHFKENLLVA